MSYLRKTLAVAALSLSFADPASADPCVAVGKSTRVSQNDAQRMMNGQLPSGFFPASPDGQFPATIKGVDGRAIAVSSAHAARMYNNNTAEHLFGNKVVDDKKMACIRQQGFKRFLGL